MDELEVARKKRHGGIAITITLNYDSPPDIDIEPDGRCEFAELEEAFFALSAAHSIKYRYDLESLNPGEAVLRAIDEDWNRRQIRNWLQERRDERIAFELPWLCSFENCRRRFTTERGAKIHERSCRHKPSSTS